MTNWLPDIGTGDGPIYVRLADRIEQDISAGLLAAGAKLPPQRDLAYDLGVTVGTVGRAYALMRERGLLSGEVGRGTYVRGRSVEGGRASAPAGDESPLTDGTRLYDAPAEKLRFDSTAAPDVGQSDEIRVLLGAIEREHPAELASYTRRFPQAWSAAGVSWLARNGFRPAPECVVPTLGVHAGVMAAISAATAPGDGIAFEHVTYSQLARSTRLIGRRTMLVTSDEEGVIPEDFERLCAQRHPKMAFLMPTAQNPTLSIMPEARRRQIAAIAARHNVLLVEDDLYGALTDDPTPLLSEFAPDRTFLVGGLSKSVAAGVRGGWVLCPPHFTDRVRIAHKMTTGGMPFMLAELGARLVLSGAAAAIRKRVIGEINARLALAREALDGFDFVARPNIPFLWLALPEPWLSGTFKNAAFEQGVLIDDEDEFKAGRTEQVFHRARLGISAPRRREEVARGLAVIRDLLDGGRAGYDSFG